MSLRFGIKSHEHSHFHAITISINSVLLYANNCLCLCLFLFLSCWTRPRNPLTLLSYERAIKSSSGLEQVMLTAKCLKNCFYQVLKVVNLLSLSLCFFSFSYAQGFTNPLLNMVKTSRSISFPWKDKGINLWIGMDFFVHLQMIFFTQSFLRPFKAKLFQKGKDNLSFINPHVVPNQYDFPSAEFLFCFVFFIQWASKVLFCTPLSFVFHRS